MSVAPLKSQVNIHAVMAKLSATEVLQKYTVSLVEFHRKIQCQNDKEQIRKLNMEFEKLLSKRRGWVCTLDEIKKFEKLWSKNPKEIYNLLQQINSTVMFELPNKMKFNPSLLGIKDLEFFRIIKKV